MLALDPALPQKMPFLQNPILQDMEKRQALQDPAVKQIISFVNVNPEDYLEVEPALALVKEANQELLETVQAYPDQFFGGVAMLALNNIEGSLEILEDFVVKYSEIVGVQLFSRHLGLSIADQGFRLIFEKCAELDIPIWLHPVFDNRKPDNNIVFSWEYEQSQAMLQLVEAGVFQDYPNLKIIVHHAGALAPFFSGRIQYILPEIQVEDFRKFYVDTAILGNPKALELTLDYFGLDRVLFGTDAPLGIAPAGATQVILEAIDTLPLSQEEKQAIYSENIKQLLKESK
ncbi:TPA: amidohydrolase family protein [Streptococcus suis 2651]|uniref:amidohydrolase family protein n=1 Tax=Streptococcus suis TaxID=1307 RepID=UPI0006ACF545|nr:amidohydrolase family protein [Streptococcus suis]HEL1669190.1 amidohydrolase family protein [Streptococcus suis]HEL1754454.1 amidohydrolase family protein [Streptococcus suis]HEM3221877.1 amidohydrolase family protein [Streptococcus suis 2651]